MEARREREKSYGAGCREAGIHLYIKSPGNHSEITEEVAKNI